MPITHFLYLPLALVMAAHTAHADWARTSGPTHGGVRGLAVKGQHLFAATWGGDSAGFFRTADKGASWTRMQGGLTGTYGMAIEAFGGTLYAGTEDAGAFRSTDDGATWKQINKGLPDTVIYCFLQAGNMLYAGTGGGLARSADQGDTWAALKVADRVNRSVTALVQIGTTILAATGRGIHASADGGDSWKFAGEGIPDTAYVTALAVSGGSVIASTYDGIYRSTNLGASWIRADLGKSDAFCLGLVAVGTEVLAGCDGVYRSQDEGRTWNNITTEAVRHGVYDLTALDGILFAATDNDGVCRRSLSEIATGIRSLQRGPLARRGAPDAYRAIFAAPAGHGRPAWFDAKGARLGDIPAR